MKQEAFLEIPSCWERIIRLVYPVKCMICDEVLREDFTLYLCEPCKKTLPRNGKGFRKMLQLPYIDGLLAAFYYEAGIDKAIHSMKFANQPLLSGTMAVLLYEELMKEDVLPDFDMIIPVPMYSRKKRRRGYNQSELVARKLSRYLNVPMNTNVLTKTRNTRPQSLLKREERLHNMDGVFMIKSGYDVCGKIILLVDDVVTTGTTLNTCAKILYDSGASWIFAAVIAIAEK